MRILYVSHFYPPETAAAATRVSELSRHWVQAGHNVCVLTSFPNYPNGVVPSPYRDRLLRLTMRERMDGVEVIRAPLIPASNDRSWKRMINYGSFTVGASLRGLSIPRPDVVIGTSPHLFAALAAWWLARRFRRPFVFEVRDLWPESLVGSGVGQKGSRLIGLLEGVAAFLYKRAELIVTVTQAQKKNLLDTRGLPSARIAVVENGVDDGLFQPLDSLRCRDELGIPHDDFVLSYVGTIGLAHGIGSIVEMASLLREPLPNARVLLVGDGAHRDELAKQLDDAGLDNVKLVPLQPRQRVPLYVNASDGCLVTLRRADIFDTALPSKMLEIMACARPVILAAGRQARQVLEAAEAGLSVDSGNAQRLAQAALRLAGDPELGERLGRNGQDYVARHFRRQEKAQEYLAHLDQVVGSGS